MIKFSSFADNHIVTKAQILDIQSGGDTRALTVDRVGICGIRLPMNFDEGRTLSPVGWGVEMLHRLIGAITRHAHVAFGSRLA